MKRTSLFKLAGASVRSTTGRRAVHISLQGLYCLCKPVFCGHVMLTGYPRHSLVSPSHPLLFVTVCHHISTGLLTYLIACGRQVVCIVPWTTGVIRLFMVIIISANHIETVHHICCPHFVKSSITIELSFYFQHYITFGTDSVSVV